LTCRAVKNAKQKISKFQHPYSFPDAKGSGKNIKLSREMGEKKTNARNKNIACDLFWSPVNACVFSKWFDFFAGGATLVFFQNVLQNLGGLCPNGNFPRCSSFCSIFTIFFGISKWLSFRLCFYLSLLRSAVHKKSIKRVYFAGVCQHHFC